VLIVDHSSSDVSPVFLAESEMGGSVEVHFIDVIGTEDIAFAANFDHHLGVSPGGFMHLFPVPFSFSHAHTRTPVSTNANGISLVSDCSNAVVPVALGMCLIGGIQKVHGVESILVHDQGLVGVDYGNISCVAPTIFRDFFKFKVVGVTGATVDTISVEA